MGGRSTQYVVMIYYHYQGRCKAYPMSQQELANVTKRYYMDIRVRRFKYIGPYLHVFLKRPSLI